MWKDEATIVDILLAAQDIQKLSARKTRDQFANDQVIQWAVIFKIIVLGEATKRLSDEFREKHPQIDWKQIAGVRDRCVHGYDRIDINKVWQVISEDAPKLEQYLKTVIPEP
jgi:uncharacterized protein with HEPN domain